MEHAFEMLLKGKIWQERGTISEVRSRISHTFDKCLRIARDDLQIIDGDAFVGLTILSELRDCAAHNLLELSEDSLYLQIQAGTTLFAKVLDAAYGNALAEYLPNRVLPISTNPPTDIQVFLDSESDEIRVLLAPGRRQQAEAHARLRPLLIMESAVQETAQQPTTNEVARVAHRLKQGENWRTVFPGINTLRLDTSGSGLTFNVRLTRETNAPPVRVLRPGEDATGATLIREVDLLDRFSMGVRDLARQLDLTVPKASALIHYAGIEDQPDCFREVHVGSSVFKRYSPLCLEKLRRAKDEVDLGEVWAAYRTRGR